MQILILGMHRSGTSVATRLVNLMGAYCGPEDRLLPPMPDNPRGFWEQRDVKDLNDRILDAGGGSWDNVADFSWEAIGPEARSRFLLEIDAKIRCLDSERPWVLKDPRFCITLPLWGERLQCPLCVYVYRSPVDIALSLKRRNEFPVSAGIGLWELYTVSFLNASRNVEWLVVDGLELVRQPVEAAERLRQDLEHYGIYGLGAPDGREVIDYVDTKLMRFQQGADQEHEYMNQVQLRLAEAVRDGSRALNGAAYVSAGGREAQRHLEYQKWRENRLNELEEQVSEEVAEQAALVTRVESLRNLISGIDRDISDIFDSWRWKIGHAVVSIFEKILLRGDVSLAKENVMSLLEEYRESGVPGDRLDSQWITGSVKDAGPARAESKDEFAAARRRELDEFRASGESVELPTSCSPRVTIVLVLYKRVEFTYWCLRSIAEFVTMPAQVVVVVNGATRDTAAFLRQVQGATVIENSENLGYGPACNQGADVARGDYLLFLNDDARLLPGSLSAALACMEKSTGAGVVGGRIVSIDGRLQEAGCIIWNDGSCHGYGRGASPLRPEFMFRRNVDFCSGVFLLTPRPLYLELGGFDERFAPAYYEDADYCVRVSEKGLRILYEPDAMVVHFEYASSGSLSDVTNLHKKNQRHFVAKHKRYLESRYDPDLKNVIKARVGGTARRVLYIDDRVPHIVFGSGFPRANLTVRSLSTLGFLVTVYPLNFPNEDQWEDAYRDIPKDVEIVLGSGRTGLGEFLRSRKDYFDAIIVSRPHNMRFFNKVLRTNRGCVGLAKIVYDSEALVSLRDRMSMELKGRKISDLDFEKSIRREVELTKSADIVYAASSLDRDTFATYGVDAAYVLSHATDAAPTDREFDQRRHILFVGNLDYDHAPNVDSLIWFVEEVFPRVLDVLQDVVLHIAGSCRSRMVWKLRGERIKIHGRVDDLRRFYDSARIFIAPTRFAAGVPCKIIESAGFGLPVVATSLLVRQLGWTADRDIVEAGTGDSRSYAEQCVRLYTEEDLWRGVRQNALARVTGQFSTQAYIDVLEESMTQLFSECRSVCRMTDSAN